MNILVLTHRSNFSGGANRSLLAVLKGLKAKGHNIDVVLPKATGELNDALTKEGINWWHCQYYRMGAKPLSGALKLVSYAILYVKYIHHKIKGYEIYKKIKNKKYDVVYTNTILPYCGLFAAEKLNIPSVIHDREPLDGTDVPQIIGYEKFLYNHANKIIVISSDLRNQWARRGFVDKIVLITNGIPIQKVMISTQDMENGCFNILLTARIAPMKHHMDALMALKKIKVGGVEKIKLFFAGSEGEKSDGIYRKMLTEYIDKNGLEDNVVFLGEVKDMGQLRSHMNAELMCNPDEPFGRVTVEGMRSGLIVIGVNSGGTIDIIVDGLNGLLYEKDNIDDLANKILKVYGDEEYRKRLALQAIEYGNSHFTMEENINKIESVLFSAVQQSRIR